MEDTNVENNNLYKNLPEDYTLEIKPKPNLLGFTFKENCPDVRNTKVVDVIHQLESYGTKITIYDPWANPKEVMREYGLTTTKDMPDQTFDAVILAVAHKEFISMNIKMLLNTNSILYDVKGILKEKVDGRL